jgi:hypothetical protein
MAGHKPSEKKKMMYGGMARKKKMYGGMARKNKMGGGRINYGYGGEVMPKAKPN